MHQLSAPGNEIPGIAAERGQAKEAKKHNRALRQLQVVIWVLLLTVSALASGSDGSDYPEVTGPCHFYFPEDHGQHPDFRTEWWYYTGNLQTPSGNNFGFQLTFFRRRIEPPGSETSWPSPSSKWRTSQIYLAHTAFSDIQNRRFYYDEDMSRAFPGVAGAFLEDGKTKLILKKWSATIGSRAHKLQAVAKDFSFTLNLKPLKEPVSHGENGYSRKGTSSESASCYYSFTRLAADGNVTVAGETHPVSGSAWMDHEFSSSPLEPDLVGWDWFSIQFSDHSDLMVYVLRQKDGKPSPASSGTFVGSDGKIVKIPYDDMMLEIAAYWRSPQSGANYPSGWRLKILSLDIDLPIKPRLDNQELLTPQTTGITYWEGSVQALGNVGNRDVSGIGYVELTGYAHPINP